jgi:hypothetical protein
MEVKDFSEKIVNAARGDAYSSYPDHLGFVIGGFTAVSTFRFCDGFLFSSLPLHISGAASGVASYLIQRLSEKQIDPKLSRYRGDARFKKYGLDTHYEPKSADLKDFLNDFTQKHKDMESAPAKKVASYAVRDSLSVLKDMIKSTSKTLKILTSKIRSHDKLLFESSLVALDAVVPPVGYGALAKTSVDYTVESDNVKEIERALEIGDAVDKMIGDGLSRREINSCLNALIKGK